MRGIAWVGDRFFGFRVEGCESLWSGGGLRNRELGPCEWSGGIWALRGRVPASSAPREVIETPRDDGAKGWGCGVEIVGRWVGWGGGCHAVAPLF
jgi:hypothetical protein